MIKRSTSHQTQWSTYSIRYRRNWLRTYLIRTNIPRSPIC